MRKLAYIFYQPYKWLFFIPAFFTMTFVLGVLAFFFSIPAGSRLTGKVFGVNWARVATLLTPVIVKVKGRENIRKRQSYVIIANHQSAYDILVLYGWLRTDIRWVMKRELRYIPGLGFGSRVIGHVFIDRSSAKASLKSIQRAKKNIGQGTSLIFFPEGSRSLTGEVGQFKKGAFKTAYDLNFSILPVTVNGTRNICPTGTLDILPGKVNIQIHEPIDINGYDYNQVGELMEKTRSVICSGIDVKYHRRPGHKGNKIIL
jgi:1-acyl-sn-glycerol-3-phosphate acyltransferase